MTDTTDQKYILIIQCTVCHHVTRDISTKDGFKPGDTLVDFSCSAKTCDHDEGYVVDVLKSPTLHCGTCGRIINVLIDDFMQTRSTGKVKCMMCGLKRRPTKRK